MRRAARTDANHASVLQALRSVGWWVLDTSRVGSGFPDAMAARRGQVVFIEIKDGAKVPSARKLTKAEASLHSQMAAAGVSVRIISSIEEAVRL